jgi:predicted methyltransferase
LTASIAAGCSGKTGSVTTSDNSGNVRPGINDPYQDPDVEVWVNRFETESREIFRERARIIERAGIQPGMAVADVGAGTGVFIPLLSAAVGDAGSVLAVDVTEAFLEHIRDRAAERGLSNVRTVHSQQDSVALPAGSIDLAIICDTYHHFEYPDKMMTSIHEALRPAGRIVVIDFEREEGKSRDWILNHVRAGRPTVIEEITRNGFELIDDGRDVDFLEENYIIQFRKAGA